jgi:hypothetical protein
MHASSARAFLVALLLGVFALALTPRDWLHHCDQAGVDHHHPETAAFHADLDCEICQVLFATFDGSALSLVPLSVPAYLLEFQEVSHVPVPGREHPAASRGPPRIWIA